MIINAKAKFILPAHVQFRQRLPIGYAAFKSDEQRRLWRWVLWDVNAVTWDEAEALRRLHPADTQWALIAAERGPKGGWTESVFIRRTSKMILSRTRRTLYLAWVFDDNVPSHLNVPKREDREPIIAQFETVKASMALHAGT